MTLMLPRIIAAAMALLPALAFGATVSRDDSCVYFTETTDAGSIDITFTHCMANHLFTFHTVKLNNKLVNSAEHSDNIGPFLLADHGWTGGNHLSDNGNTTARTASVEVKVDGQPFTNGTRQGNRAEITVVNHLLMPDSSLFAIETITYLVAGNSIEVWADHSYRISSPVRVDRYYGMQSMFEGETHILVPTSPAYNRWLEVTPGGADNSIRISHSEAPRLSAFVEKSPNGYQACYMVRENLGDRAMVGADDLVFVGNSYRKCYHKLMGNTLIHPGETTRWHGVYSWFNTPHTDTFALGEPYGVFTYRAYMEGKPTLLSINHNGEVQSLTTTE